MKRKSSINLVGFLRGNQKT